MTDEQVRFFKALGEETRLEIVSYLINHECFACDFISMTKKDQTTLTHHLKILVDAGILIYEKTGRNKIYRIKDKKILEKLKVLGIEGTEHDCCKKVD